MSCLGVSAMASGFLGTKATLPRRQYDRKLKSVSTETTIECSSRPQKKATAHHMKTRPKKTQPWDIRRKPAVYDPLPPLPPDWTLTEPAIADEPSSELELPSSVE